MRYTVTQFARESVGLCPFRGSYVREFELSHSNPVSRIITINHEHNLQVKTLDFARSAKCSGLSHFHTHVWAGASLLIPSLLVSCT